MTIKKILTIAGSEASGGAGVQADLKTFQEHDTYGLSALTVVVSMDPATWKHSVFPLPIDLLQKQIDTALSTGIDAIKTGMLNNEEVIESAGKAIVKSGLSKVVVDPVIICKGDAEPLNPGTVDAMKQFLIPHALVITPNLIEAGNLAGMSTPKSIEEMKDAAVNIHALGAKNVFITGGSRLDGDTAVDLLYDGNTFTLLEAEKCETDYNHGAGCTLAAAITANLANGLSVKDAVSQAKQFVTAAIVHGIRLNEFVGAVQHGAKNKFGAADISMTEV